MRRSEARENLMKMLFQMEAQKDYSEQAKALFTLEYMADSDQLEYFDTVWNAYFPHKEEIDAMIEQSSEKWHIARMSRMDLAVLRLAVTEIKYVPEKDVPASVAINEAVNLAKKYGTDESSKFVNGVLGKLMKEENA